MTRSVRGGKVSPGVLVTIGIVAVVAALVAWPTDEPGGIERTTDVRPPDSTAAASSQSTDSPILTAPAGQAEPPIGEFYYMMDISASTKDSTGASAFTEGIALLQPIFGSLREMKELSPQRHRVATIGAMSLRLAPKCDIYVAAQTLFSANDNAALASRAMAACERDFRALQPEQFTDISGALVNAGLSLQGKRRAMRGVVLITDLEEDIQPGATAGQPDLHGMCVAIFTLVTPATARDPRLLAERSTEWTAKLRGWGAKNVYSVNARGFAATDLRGFFRSCEG
jgi:hypothetical protein